MNGYIIPIAETDTLHEKIGLILNDCRIKDLFGQESLKRVQPYTLENMAQVNLSILSNYVKEKKENTIGKVQSS
ncbi:hypothetical protein SDC9_142674 [bioreactor metagenome]|uniref:Uncharacterized protein n=1 Tax=bioreactor metagenome TaxID=1076179 RepID=A0A645E1T5_9ZZZZ